VEKKRTPENRQKRASKWGALYLVTGGVSGRRISVDTTLKKNAVKFYERWDGGKDRGPVRGKGIHPNC